MREPKRITSRDNPAVKEAAALLSSAAKRRQTGLFAAEGLRLCLDAARSGVRIPRVFALPELLRDDRLRPVLEAAEEICEVPPHVAEKLSDTRTPQGILCIGEIPPESPPEPLLRPGNAVLALERVQDPANLGAAARTAEAFGFAGIVLSADSCSPFNPKALRASMGAFFRIPVCRVPDLPAFLAETALPSFASVPEGGIPVTEADFSAGCVLLVGNEGSGLSEAAVAACTRRITVPMAGKAQSLNASAAAAVLMWEAVRGRTQNFRESGE